MDSFGFAAACHPQLCQGIWRTECAADPTVGAWETEAAGEPNPWQGALSLLDPQIGSVWAAERAGIGVKVLVGALQEVPCVVALTGTTFYCL